MTLGEKTLLEGKTQGRGSTGFPTDCCEAPDPLDPVGIDATLGRYWRVAWRWANSVHRVDEVGRPMSPSRSTEIAKGVGR